MRLLAVFCEGTDEEPVPMRKLCEVLFKRLLTFEGTVILFLESLRICCVLCESQKLTKITSFACGIYSQSPHSLVPCLEYYRCSICGTVRWTQLPGSSPHPIPASQSESSNASATMADGFAWNEFVVGNARCKFAVSKLLLWNKRKLS